MDINCFFFNDVVDATVPSGVGYYDVGKILTSSECDDIFSSAIDFEIPLISGEHPVPNETYTNARIGSLYINDDSLWAYERITSVAREHNNNIWQLDVLGTYECMDIIEYSSPHGGMGWHIDLSTGGNRTANRKVNILLQLSEPDEYEGGELQLFVPHENKDEPIVTLPKEKGNMVVFPPWIPHRVCPVTSGKRRSMVTYLHGPPLR